MTTVNDNSAGNLQKLTTLLTQAVREADFPLTGIDSQGPTLRFLQPSELKDLYYGADPDSELKALKVWPRLTKDLTEELSDCLALLLEDYVGDGRIGNGFVPFGGGLADYGIAEFALDAVRAAAIQGPEATVELLQKWAVGERAPYQLCAVLSGVTADESLDMGDGILFTPLSRAVGNVSVHLPPHSTSLYGLSDLSNGLMVSIDCVGGPALRKPEEYGQIERLWNHGPLPDNLLDELCEALSLVCDQYIKWWLEWSDCGEAKIFRLGATYGHSRRRNEGRPNGMATLTKEDMPNLRDIFMKLLNDAQRRKALDIAIGRWMNSKGRSGLTDKLIEARIALEALYLTDSNAELRFRLATNGAWHLGDNFEERCEYDQKLRKVYDLASKAVHRGEVEDIDENRDVLRDGQDLCRRGILKQLREGNEPDFSKLILGRDI